MILLAEAMAEAAPMLELLFQCAASVAVAVKRVESGGAYEADVYSGEGALAAVEKDWDVLLGACTTATVFQSRAVAEVAAAAHAAKGQELHIVVVRQGGEAVAILPLVMTALARHRVLRLIGDPLIQYGDALLSSAGSAQHLHTAFDAVRKIPADAILFRKVRDDACIAAVLQARGKKTSYETGCSVDLRRGRELSARDLRELRRCRRRLAETGSVDFRVAYADECLRQVQLALEMKRQWLNARNASSAVVGDLDWERALLELARPDRAVLATASLSVGGECAAIEVAMFRGNQWIAFLGALNPTFAKYGPGQVQMDFTVQYAREKGFARYDLLAPADAFKKTIANDEIGVTDYAIPLSLRGRALCQAFRLTPTVKRLLAVSPTFVRNGIQRALNLQ